jgi:hypothetical protein
VVASVGGGASAEGKPPVCRLQVWDVESGENRGDTLCDPDAIQLESLLIGPDNKRSLISWGGYAAEHNRVVPPQLSLYDLSSGKELTRILDPGALIGFSPDGRTFVVGGDAKGRQRFSLNLDSFAVYNSDSGKPLVTLHLQAQQTR